MTGETEIKEAFTLLREICDPRGHSLLAALENLLLVESTALEGIVNIGRAVEDMPTQSNVVSMIDRYSRHDTDSRKAPA